MHFFWSSRDKENPCKLHWNMKTVLCTVCELNNRTLALERIVSVRAGWTGKKVFIYWTCVRSISYEYVVTLAGCICHSILLSLRYYVEKKALYTYRKLNRAALLLSCCCFLKLKTELFSDRQSANSRRQKNVLAFLDKIKLGFMGCEESPFLILASILGSSNPSSALTANAASALC